MKATRRSFLTSSAAASVPFILPSHIWAAETKPNDRKTIGFVGMGKQSGGLLGNFLNQDTQVVAVCDVDTTRREHARDRVNKHYTQKPDKGTPDCAAYEDFRELMARKDIDMVCVATPDHWHALIVLEALRSGKDVYCEKPLTHNIHEAVEIIRAVDANKRVLQTGSQQRSSREFRTVADLVKNGAIGKLTHIEVSFGDAGIPCNLGEEAAEPGLNWDMWLGPAPARAYHSELSPRGIHNHFPNWRRYSEFGGGMVTDWGAHQIDIAQWAMDESGPVEVIPPAGAGDKRGAQLRYASGVTVTHLNGFGVHFHGTEGEAMVNRGKFEFKRGGQTVAKWTQREDGGSLEGALVKAEREFLNEKSARVYNSSNHVLDFIKCVDARKKPVASEQAGARTAISCHLMNLAYWHREKFAWDPMKFTFAGGKTNPAWLTRAYRGPWSV